MLEALVTAFLGTSGTREVRLPGTFVVGLESVTERGDTKGNSSMRTGPGALVTADSKKPVASTCEN